MLRNYINVALRHLKKNRVYTVINLSGLSVGITCCLLIFLYVSNELSFDRGFENKDNIYRLLREFTSTDDKGLTPATAGPYGPTLQMEFPDDIKKMTRIFPDNGLISIDDNHIQEEKLCFADSNFFDLFSFAVISGEVNEVLSQPNYAVLSEEGAFKYFGDQDPIGKEFEIDGRYRFIVSGIFRNTFNSTLNFDVVVPIAIFRDRSWFNNWRSNGFYTYVELNPSTDIAAFEAKLVPFMDNRINTDSKRTGSRTDLLLQPMTDVYLNISTEFDFVPHGSSNLVYSLIGIAIFILAIACINFINLSTAKYTVRLNEVGIRKVLGAYRSNLRVQFLVESSVLALFSLVVGIALLEAILPLFNDFSSSDLDMVYVDPSMIGIILGLVLIVGVVAGIYPAFYLSSFQPIKVFRGSVDSKKSTANLRKSLVIIQFSISVVLIVGTGVIYEQLNFIQNKELGFDKDQVAIIEINNRELIPKWESFRANLLNRSDIKSVTLTSGEPGGFHDQFIREIDEKDNQAIPLRTVFTDHDYLKTFGLRVVSGRDFNHDYATDATGAVVLNETAVRRIGWTLEEAIGKEITEPVIPGWNETRVTKKVIGVVEDYHFSSMHETIEPVIITVGGVQNGYIGIKLEGGEIRSAIDAIEVEWKKIVSRHPLELTFLDDRINSLYQTEIQQGKLFTIFSVLAIFIGCLGLYGLVAFSAEQRKKEIGIRKVHGASVSSIVFLLSKDFTKLIVVAQIVAIPIAYYLMQQWLADFAYQIDMGWNLFVLAGGIALLISWITVSYEAFKAANSNPVDALRYE